MERLFSIDETERILEGIATPELAESWDNCGFQVVDRRKDVSHILTALEITSDVIDEAVELGADLVVTHHPMIFGGINSVDSQDVTGEYIFRLMKNGISVYSAHTNFDRVQGGNGDYIGRLLEAKKIRTEEFGEGFVKSGIIRDDNGNPLTAMAVSKLICKALNMERNSLRLIGEPERLCSRICWVTGSGADFIRDAKYAGFDLIITGDVKYHDAMWAKEAGICVVDAGHFGTERIFAENMAKLLQDAFLEKRGTWPAISISHAMEDPFYTI